jgi:hypothetical protein
MIIMPWKDTRKHHIVSFFYTAWWLKNSSQLIIPSMGEKTIHTLYQTNISIENYNV